MSKTLLPAGCYDLLPPIARQESELSGILLSVFESFGYEQVAPPLLEYSENLLGASAELSPQVFRVMDPMTHKVMGLRTDITPQIARIARSRLLESPRPLRLCYNGLILRMQGERLDGNRQLRQTGIELIGASSPEADAEVIMVAARALKAAGVTELSIDLNLPGIVAALLASEKLSNEALQTLLEAVAHKDISTVRTLKLACKDTLIQLMECAGPAAVALKVIEKLKLPEKAKQQCRDLNEVVSLLASAKEGWTVTIDATEKRGLGYHSGISFSMFVPGAACEVGRGGRYRIEGGEGTRDCEATGFTLYLETLRNLLPVPSAKKRVLISGATGKEAEKLRSQGYVTVNALLEYGNDEEEAKRLGCGWIYKNGKLKTL